MSRALSDGGQDQTIGPYEIVERLGEGGMGVVYRGRNPNTGEHVAVKTARANQTYALSSLRSEIAALARVHHPGVVRILSHGSKDGVPWYAMELLSGETWDDFNRSIWVGSYGGTEKADGEGIDFDQTTRARPSLDESAAMRPQVAGGRLQEVLSLARRLCSSLSVLHGQGFVHRDLKPSNIFIVGDRPVVTDLGIASRFRGAVGREKIEQAGKLVGTVRYMAPEQARGLLVDARADLFALGTLMYETLTGRLPFRSDSVNEWIRRVLEEEPPPPSQLVDGLPPRLEELIFSLLAKRPRDRIGHADDVARVLESLGAAEDDVPGIDTPAYLYRSEMAGRGDVLLELEQAIVRSTKGTGQIVLIGGESGVGKTFLASEAARSATLRRLNVIIGECLPINVGKETRVDLQGAPLHPFRPLLHAAADLAITAGEECRERLFGTTRARLLSSYEPSLATLPGVSTTSLPNLPGELARQRILDAAIETIEALIEEEGPLVLLLDDLQWADDLSLALLQHLLKGKLAELKLLIIGTYRSDEVTSAMLPLVDNTAVRNIALKRLDETSVGAMVSDMLAMSDPPKGFVAFLAEQSEGNPFFVAEYLRLAASERLLRREGGRWQFSAKSDTPEAYAKLSLPASLKDLISRRLAGLSDAAREVLEAAAVLGRELERDLLDVVTEQTGSALDDAIKELVVRQVIDADEDTFRFVHDKLRETTYAAIGPDRRMTLSRSAAVALEARAASGEGGVDHGVLAHFWTEARAWPKAIDALERSAEECLRDFSTDQAIRTFENLQEITDRERIDVGPTRRGRWERGLADAHFAGGRDFEGRRHVSSALVLLGQRKMPTSQVGQAIAVLSEIATYIVQGSFRRLFVIGPGLKRTRLSEAAYAYNRMIEPTFRNNEPLLAVFCNFRNVNLALRMPPTPALVRGYAMLANVAGVSPLQGIARRWAKRAIALAETLDSPATLGYVLARICAYYVTAGSWRAADSAVARALEIARSLSDRRSIGEARLTHSIGLCAEGRFEEQLEALSDALPNVLAAGDDQIVGWSRCGLAEVYARTGRDPEARALIPRLKEWVAGPLEQAEAVWAHAAIALVSMQTGDPDQARAQADRAVALMRESPPFPFFVTPGLWDLAEVYLDLGEAHADGGDVQAKAVLTQLRDLVAIHKTYAKMIRIARPFAKLSEAGLLWRTQKASAAYKTWRQALALSERMEMSFPEARACYDLGRHLEGEERLKYLTRAAEIQERLGARTDLVKTRAAIESGKIAL